MKLAGHCCHEVAMARRSTPPTGGEAGTSAPKKSLARGFRFIDSGGRLLPPFCQAPVAGESLPVERASVHSLSGGQFLPAASAPGHTGDAICTNSGGGSTHISALFRLVGTGRLTVYLYLRANTAISAALTASSPQPYQRLLRLPQRPHAGGFCPRLAGVRSSSPMVRAMVQ